MIVVTYGTWAAGLEVSVDSAEWAAHSPRLCSAKGSGLSWSLLPPSNARLGEPENRLGQSWPMEARRAGLLKAGPLDDLPCASHCLIPVLPNCGADLVQVPSAHLRMTHSPLGISGDITTFQVCVQGQKTLLAPPHPFSLLRNTEMHGPGAEHQQGIPRRRDPACICNAVPKG